MSDKITHDQLKQLQNLPLWLKIKKTEQRIREWYEVNNGDVYVSFSGGKDSQVLLYLVRRLYPDVVAVFCDTGLEYPEIREHVKTIENVTWLKPKMRFDEVIIKYGYPIISKEQSQFIGEAQTTKSEKLRNKRLNGQVSKNGKLCGKISNKWIYLVYSKIRISNKCCGIMKKRPFHEFEKNGLKPFVGTIAEESSLRLQDYKKFGCNSFDSIRPRSTPLGFWTEDDILHFLHSNKISISKIYGKIEIDNKANYCLTGEHRTGCMFCAYGCHLEDKNNNKFIRMKRTHPKIWKYIMDDLGYREVLKIIGVQTGE